VKTNSEAPKLAVVTDEFDADMFDENVDTEQHVEEDDETARSESDEELTRVTPYDVPTSSHIDWGSELRGKYFSELLICTDFLDLSFIIVTTIVHATLLGRFTNEATDALSHPPNTVASHSALRAFAEVSMVSISILQHTISLNSLI
jgi:hypothetical protein